MLTRILHTVACTCCGAATTRPFKSFGPFLRWTELSRVGALVSLKNFAHKL
jgi:hypothetical protein